MTATTGPACIGDSGCILASEDTQDSDTPRKQDTHSTLTPRCARHARVRRAIYDEPVPGLALEATENGFV